MSSETRPFIVSCFGQKVRGVPFGRDIPGFHSVSLLKAHSEAEAIGLGLAFAKETHPASDGYGNYDVIAKEVPVELLSARMAEAEDLFRRAAGWFHRFGEQSSAKMVDDIAAWLGVSPESIATAEDEITLRTAAEEAERLLAMLGHDERLAVMKNFCRLCGGDDPDSYCCRDDRME